MPQQFKDIEVAPQLPTTLGEQEWLRLPASDFSFYPAVNSNLLPGPVEEERLRNALSQTLQLFPSHCGAIMRHPVEKTLQIRLLNRAVRLSIGTTDEAGPFAEDWKAERHPDYYDELPRGNTKNSQGVDIPLFQARVTTWNKTGQTSIFVSQSYALGDAFAALWFLKSWSSFYVGERPQIMPSFEKYDLPVAQIQPKPSHAKDLEHISFMIADFDEEYFEKRNAKMEEDTERIDHTFDGAFVDAVWIAAQQKAGKTKVSRHDAFSGYLVSVVQGLLDEPADYLHQLIALRGRTMTYNGESFTFPPTTTGNAYIIYGCDLGDPSGKIEPLDAALKLKNARKPLQDTQKLGRIYMLYNSLYKKAIDSDRIFIDSGYRECIAMNWIVQAGLTDPHFGYKNQVIHIEWESLENFMQVWRANAVKQPDGSWWADPDGLQLLLRLRKGCGKQFKEKLAADRQRFLAKTGASSKL